MKNLTYIFIAGLMLLVVACGVSTEVVKEPPTIELILFLETLSKSAWVEFIYGDTR
jgi:hypothetical protein